MTKDAFCHIEWSTTDLEKTSELLSGLFGWKFESWGEEYMIYTTPKGIGGGIMKVDRVEPGKSPSVYVDVDEIEPYLQKAQELGAEIDVPKTEIPEVGWYAHIKDSDGNVYGIVQGFPEQQKDESPGQ
ncbi:MAG: VOC family protein [Thermoplasmata archaeon]